MRILECWQDVLGAEEFHGLYLASCFNRLAIFHRRRIANYAAEYGLSEVDAILMVLLRGLKKSPIYMSDIWRLYEYTPGAVTHRTGRLRKLEFVRTRKSDVDSRATIVEFTDPGRAAIDAITAQATADFAQLWRRFGFSNRQASQFEASICEFERLVENAASRPHAPSAPAKPKPPAARRKRARRTSG